MIHYNPFSKSLAELTTADLTVLKTVSEGWYVEYKLQVSISRPTARIAKSLSAFANHYGGWLFYGIESDSQSTVAVKFPGVAVTDVPMYERELRNAARNIINPPPSFAHKVLLGPCEELGLPSDRAIIAVQIPSGHNAPYIHGDGRIYRRVADSSEPRPETDRATLDILYERGRSDRSKLAAFITRTPRLSEFEEKNLSFLQLFLMPDPLDDRATPVKINFDRFAQIMGNSDPKTGGIPFSSSYTTSDGFIARQIAGNDPYSLAMTWRYQNNGNSEIIFPISSTGFTADLATNLRLFEGYKYTDKFMGAVSHQGFQTISIIDINFLFPFLAAVIRKYTLLATECDHRVNFFAKVACHNIWRRVPFLDTEGYLEFITSCSVPVIQDDDVLAPPGTEPEALLELQWRNFDNSTQDDVWLYEQVAALLVPILTAWGIPPHRGLGIGKPSFREIFDLRERALQVQRQRRSK